jgi:hypothetical protein
MDDERWEPGMPVLDRQPAGAASGRITSSLPQNAPPTSPSLPPSLRGLPPRSVPEAKPTPLQRHYINLSVVALVAGAVAITALNVGAGLDSPLVKLCVALAAPILVLTTADAGLRIWRSAWAWMPVDRGKGLFRLSWVAATAVLLAAIVGAAAVVLTA